MKRIILFCLTLCLCLVPSIAWAEERWPPVCAERATLVEQLHQQYGEFPVARGLSISGGVVERFEASDGRTWSILITFPTGKACMIAAGEHWETIVPVKGEAS